MSRRLLIIAIAEAVVVLIGVYGYATAFAPGASLGATGVQTITLTGAGATLSYPLLSAAAENYSSSHPGVAINYQPLGSIAGISQLTAKTVDFCVTYPPMTTAQRDAVAPNIPLHIPEAVSEVVVAYNVPGLTKLNLTGSVVADIYLGKVRYWNDPEITSLNPGQNFLNRTINTWHMSEAEGTTFVFTSYLSIVSPEFNQTIGYGTSVSWPTEYTDPTGHSFQITSDSVLTDAGVAGQMKLTDYSIGYMELSYALLAPLPYASLMNAAGNWVTPNLASALAAEGKLPQDLPPSDGDWQGINILNSLDPNAYPLVTFTYFIIYQNLSTLPTMDLAKARTLVGFAWYLIHDGQSLGAALGYDPLPAKVVQIDEVGLKSVVFQGQSLI
jgi:phosphate ABC transporter phosphate-binding protein